MVASTLADAREKANAEPKVFRLQRRKAFTKEGKYFFKVLSSKFNPKTEVLRLNGVPFKNTKSGEVVEYQRLTICVSTTCCGEDGATPITELFQCLELDLDAEVAESFFEGKTFVVDISINEYCDEAGNVTSIFYNAESFEKAN